MGRGTGAQFEMIKGNSKSNTASSTIILENLVELSHQNAAP